MIENVEQLKEELLIQGRYPNTRGAFVSTSVRKEWMLNSHTVIIKGTVRRAKFTNKGGGVWHVCLDDA